VFPLQSLPDRSFGGTGSKARLLHAALADPGAHRGSAVKWQRAAIVAGHHMRATSVSLFGATTATKASAAEARLVPCWRMIAYSIIPKRHGYSVQATEGAEVRVLRTWLTEAEAVTGGCSEGGIYAATRAAAEQTAQSLPPFAFGVGAPYASLTRIAPYQHALIRAIIGHDRLSGHAQAPRLLRGVHARWRALGCPPNLADRGTGTFRLEGTSGGRREGVVGEAEG
jgi:hypothetical protein